MKHRYRYGGQLLTEIVICLARVFRHSVSQASSSDRIAADDRGKCLLHRDACSDKSCMSNCFLYLSWYTMVLTSHRLVYSDAVS